MKGAAAARVWAWPAALGCLTLVGLLAALLGQQLIWWALSWCALALPLLVILVCFVRARGKPAS